MPTRDEQAIEILREALGGYQTILQENPTHQAALYNAGRAAMELEEFDTARAHFDALLSLNAFHELAQYQKANILFMEEAYDAAYEILHGLLRNGSQEDEVHALAAECRPFVEAKVCCIAIDLKLTPEGRVQILEIGNAESSSQSGYERLYGHSIERLIQDLLSEQGVTRVESKETLGTYHVYLQPDEDFVEPAASYREHDPRRLSTFTKMVMGVDEHPAYTPGVLRLNDSPLMGTACDDKVFFDTTMKEWGEERGCALRPQSMVFKHMHQASRQEKETLRAFMTEGSGVALKSSTSAEGAGVLLCPADEALRVWEELCQSDDDFLWRETEVFFPGQFVHPDYFTPPQLSQFKAHLSRCPERELRQSQNVFSVAERFVPSHPVVHEGEQYDPTMRVWVGVIKNEGEVSVHPLAAIWKLPASPIEGDDFRASHISEVQTGGQGRSVEVADAVFDVVKEQLTEGLKPYFERLFQTPHEAWVSETYLEHADVDKQRYGTLLVQMMVKRLRETGHCEEAHAILDDIEAYLSMKSFASEFRQAFLTERMRLYFVEKQYERVLERYAEGQPTIVAMTLKAYAHARLQQWYEARRWAETVLSQSPQYQKAELLVGALDERDALEGHLEGMVEVPWFRR